MTSFIAAQYDANGFQISTANQELNPRNDLDSSGIPDGVNFPGFSFNKAYYGSNVLVMGDSIAQNNSNIIAGTKPNTFNYSFLQRGSISNMLSFLGFPWEFQPEDNFAVFGTTLDAIIANQLPVVLTAHSTKKYTRAFMSIFTNDTNALVSMDIIQGRALTLFRALRNVGIIPVIVGVRPRGRDGAITIPKQQNMLINEWCWQLSLTGYIEYIDISEIHADNSTAFGNILAANVYDGASPALHLNGLGATLEGQVMANYYIAKGIVPGIKFATQQGDQFDRTNNIRGAAFKNANPLLQGDTGGAAHQPTGMATSGGTWAKVNRTIANGQVRTDCQCTLAASTLHYLYDDWTNVGLGAWPVTALQPGDIIEARAKVVVASGVNIQNLQLRLSENDGTNSLIHYDCFNDASSVPDGSYTRYFKTPRIAIQTYSGAGDANIFARMECQTNAGASGTYTIQNLEVRKVG